MDKHVVVSSSRQNHHHHHHHHHTHKPLLLPPLPPFLLLPHPPHTTYHPTPTSRPTQSKATSRQLKAIHANLTLTQGIPEQLIPGNQLLLRGAKKGASRHVWERRRGEGRQGRRPGPGLRDPTVTLSLLSLHSSLSLCVSARPYSTVCCRREQYRHPTRFQAGGSAVCGTSDGAISVLGTTTRNTSSPKKKNAPSQMSLFRNPRHDCFCALQLLHSMNPT